MLLLHDARASLCPCHQAGAQKAPKNDGKRVEVEKTESFSSQLSCNLTERTYARRHAHTYLKLALLPAVVHAEAPTRSSPESETAPAPYI